MKRTLSLMTVVLLFAGVAALATGCKKEEPGTMEELGQKVDEKADEAAKKAEEAMEDLDN